MVRDATSQQLKQPRFQRRLATKAIKRLQQTDKSLLNGVFGIGRLG